MNRTRKQSSNRAARLNLERAIYLGSIGLVCIVWQLVQLTDTVGTLLDTAFYAALTCSDLRCNKVERRRMFVLIVLIECDLLGAF